MPLCTQITLTPVTVTSTGMTTSNTDGIYGLDTASPAFLAVKTTADNSWSAVLGKNTIYYQTTAPTGGSYVAGDTWFDTDDGYKIYRWSGAAWVAAEFGSAAFANGSVDVNKLASGAVDASKILDGAVSSLKIANGSVDVNKLASGAVDASKILDGAVVASKILDGAVSSLKIADAAVQAAKIATGAVGSSQIAAGAIVAGKISAGAIVSADIAADTITASNIAANAIGANEIAAGAVVAGKISAGAVGATEIAANAIVAGKIAADAIVSSNIQAGQITSSLIAAGAITADMIAAGSISAAISITSASATFQAGKIGNWTIAGNDYLSGTDGTYLYATKSSGYSLVASGIVKSGDKFEVTGSSNVFNTTGTSDAGFNIGGAAGTVNAKWVPATDNAYSLGGAAASRRWSVVYCVTGTINTSDVRTKTDIADETLGLEFIERLRPVGWRFIVGGNDVEKQLDGEGRIVGEIVTPRPGSRRHHGFIAQEVRAALDDINAEDFSGWTIDDPSNPDSMQGLRYEAFIAPLVKAVQQLSAQVSALNDRITVLEAR